MGVLIEAPLPKQSRLTYIAGRVGEIRRYSDLIRYLVSGSLQVERVTMVFGFLWWLLDPILLLLVYTVVIEIVLQRAPASGYPYPIFLLAAIIPWEFSVRAMRNGITQTHAKERQMRQVAFPRAVIPIATTCTELIRLLVALALYPFIALPFGVHLSPVALLALPLVVALFLLTLGLTLFLSALNFYVRDTDRFTTHALRLWLFLSPVLYSESFVPARYRTWYQLNPFAPLLESFRSALLFHHVPSPERMAEVLAVSALVAVLGFVFFHLCEPQFAKLN